MTARPSDFKVFDFFSGCGGASCGLHAAGMDVVFALDSDTDAAATYHANFRTTEVSCGDIRRLPSAYLSALVERMRPSPIIFCGCPPCQPFTSQNTSRPNDDVRTTLLLDFGRLVKACRPDIVFVENVPGLQSSVADRSPLARFLAVLHSAGYHCRHKIVPVMKYGIPQTRRRFLLLASRRGPIDLPPYTNGPGTAAPRYATVRDAIADLPEIAAGEVHPDVPNHRAARLSALNLQRIRSTPEGSGHRAWPNHLRLPCHAKTSGYTDVYGRLAWDRPASGLTTKCISYSNGRFGHPTQDRAISIREAACLQTFPRTFVFRGSMGSIARQIGNAVPVRVARLIGQHVSKHIQQHSTATDHGHL